MAKALLSRSRIWVFRFELGREVMNMKSFSVNKYSAKWRATADRSFRTCRNASVICHKPQDIAVETKNLSVGCFTEPRSILCDDIQHGLNICGRAGDDAQNFTRGGLLFQ